MVREEGSGGTRFSKEKIPALALTLAGVMILLSFFVGWYTIDLRVERWTEDASQPESKGNELPPLIIDLQMRMFSIDMNTKPLILQQQIDSNPAGRPDYDNHAGRIGTQMLGMFLLQSASLVTFAAIAVFFSLHRRRNQLATLRRLGIVFVLLGLFTVSYFAFTIGDAAQEDTDYLVTVYRFSEESTYDISDLEVGFWSRWETDETQTVRLQGVDERWDVIAESRPSSGWWLQLGAIVLFVVGAVVQLRAEPVAAVVDGTVSIRVEGS